MVPVTVKQKNVEQAANPLEENKVLAWVWPEGKCKLCEASYTTLGIWRRAWLTVECSS